MRGRKSKIGYWAKRGGFFTTFKGKKICLAMGENDYPDGDTYKKAVKAFSTFKEDATKPVSIILPDNIIDALVEQYREYLVKAHKG